VARTLITPQSVLAAGLAPTYEPANAAGNSYRLVAGQVLHVKNADAAAHTVTINTPITVEGLTVTNRTVTVAAGAAQFIGLGSSTAHRQADGTARVDYDAVTNVTVAVLTVP
jgi:hypothetical protein